MAEIVRCKICREPERRRLIDADWAGGMSGAAIARRMTEAGWPIDDDTVIRHLKAHFKPDTLSAADQRVVKQKRDAAVFIRDRVLDRIEELESGGSKRMGITKEGELVELPFDILDPSLQPALGSALKAQAALDARARQTNDKQVMFLLAQALLGGGSANVPLLPPPDLMGDDENIIDGEAVEVE